MKLLHKQKNVRNKNINMSSTVPSLVKLFKKNVFVEKTPLMLSKASFVWSNNSKIVKQYYNIYWFHLIYFNM